MSEEVSKVGEFMEGLLEKSEGSKLHKLLLALILLVFFILIRLYVLFRSDIPAMLSGKRDDTPK